VTITSENAELQLAAEHVLNLRITVALLEEDQVPIVFWDDTVWAAVTRALAGGGTAEAQQPLRDGRRLLLRVEMPPRTHPRNGSTPGGAP
jgi:hypothetical protein